MRRFSSYGPPDTDTNYYAPRKELIEKAFTKLIGDNPGRSGNYITVWAPRQCGKSWVMLEILKKFDKFKDFDVVKVDLEHLKAVTDMSSVIASITNDIAKDLDKKLPPVDTLEGFQELFSRKNLDKPLILILDEFDALHENIINGLVGILRNIYLRRRKDLDKPHGEKRYLLHSAALIGVRSVLGIENVKGSPFNVQQSLHIPNLSYEEVKTMFQWYEKESGQAVDPEVVDRLYYETNGQPGLTCWFGELLSEGIEHHHIEKNRPVNMRDFEIIYAAATYALPNNTILNIISKSREKPEKTLVLRMFQTHEKLAFKFDDKTTNSLYMNGVIRQEVVDKTKYFIAFSCPFVQKRLFNFFSNELFQEMGTLVEPFVSLEDVITGTGLNIKNLIHLYQKYLDKNKEWLFKNAPRRMDLKIYEAVYHFNLYSYIDLFLRSKDGTVFPEFPTGNGKIDLIVTYKDKTYGLELKSYTDHTAYKAALKQAALYGKQLKLETIYLLLFVPAVDDESRKKLEADYKAPEANVTVTPIFIVTGN